MRKLRLPTIEIRLPDLAFTEDHGQGILNGLLLAWSFIIYISGIKATLYYGQFHVVTLLWLTLMAKHFYRNLVGKQGLEKFIYAGFFTFWFFEVHDVLWCIGTFWLGVRVGYPTLFPDQTWYVTAAIKYFTLLFFFTWLLRKQFNFRDKGFLALFLIQLSFHALTVYTQWRYGDLPYIFFLIIMIFDSLPYLFIQKQKQKKIMD